MKETITATIKDGKVTIEVKGVKGKGCTDLTADIEKALGPATGTRKTSEYSQAPNLKQKSKLKG